MLERTRNYAWTTQAPSTGNSNTVGSVPEEADLSSQRRVREGIEVWLPAISVLAFAGLIYLIWEVVSLSGVVSPYVLPSPLQVAQAFGDELASGDLLSNALVTVEEALGGFAVAAIVAGIAGYIMAQVRVLEALVAPFVAASQAVPVVAVAPLIILVLGTGMWPHVIIPAVVVMFPLLITVVTGLRGIDRDLRDVARVFGASRLQTLLYLELPLAAPTLLAGVKLGITLAITGAVVGEFAGGQSGLGFMVNAAIGNFQVATRYVAIVALAVLSIVLFSSVTVIERMVLRWQNA